MLSPVAEVRQAYVAAIVAGYTTSRPWHETTLPADLFEQLIPELGEQEAHYGLAIGAPKSDRLDGHRNTRVYQTTLEIRWSRIVGAERQVEDYDAGLDDEQVLLALIDGCAHARNAHVTAITRKVTSGQAGGLLLCRVELLVTHQYPVQ